jgi:RecA/RadA recombinase
MTISFVGPNVPVQRVLTGFWSFDNALANNRGERGFAVPSYAEVYGSPGVGKSNFVLSLAGIIANKFEKDIALLDLEILDAETIKSILDNARFNGTVKLIRNERDEDSLGELLSSVKDEKFGVGILDSIAAISPIAEQNGDIGDANMGRRAIVMSQFSRKTVRSLQNRESPYVMFCTNHIHPSIGMSHNGSDTSGGMTHKFMSHYRINLSKAFIKGKTIKYDDGWLLKGRIEKSRMGFAMRDFYVFMIAGNGLHKGLSAVFDCIISGQADISRTVKMDGKSFGTLSSMINNRNDDDLFTPFINKVNSLTVFSTSTEVEWVQEEINNE